VKHKLDTDEAISAGISCLYEQAHLLIETGDILAADMNSLSVTVGLTMAGIWDSCFALGVLLENKRTRDAYVAARTIYLTMVNTCFICAQGEKAAERAIRYLKQKSLRDLDRQFRRNEMKFAVKYSGLPDSLPEDVKEVLSEFTSRKGREIRSWTPESVEKQLEYIDSRFGSAVGSVLMYGFIAIYRHASEIAHGSLFGAMWAMGVTEPGSVARRDYIDASRRSREGLLVFVLNRSFLSCFAVLAEQSPSHQEHQNQSESCIR
jgi:hypothetical protein